MRTAYIQFLAAYTFVYWGIRRWATHCHMRPDFFEGQIDAGYCLDNEAVQ